MSSSFLSNIIVADVLQQNRLKPWFESVRGYIVFSCILVSAFMIYDFGNSDVFNCIPTNTSVVLSLTVSQYANEFCSQKVSWMEREPGVFTLLIGLAIYMNYAWWLHVPFVRDAFMIVRQSDNILLTVKGTKTDIYTKIRHIFSDEPFHVNQKDKDVVPALIEACSKLWFGQHKRTNCMSLAIIYLARNAIAALLVTSSLITISFLYLEDKVELLTCQLDMPYSISLNCLTPYKNKSRPYIITLAVLFGILLAFTIIVSSHVIIRYTQKKTIPNLQENRNNGAMTIPALRQSEQCNRFVEVFSHYSDPLCETTLDLLHVTEVFPPNYFERRIEFFKDFERNVKAKRFLATSIHLILPELKEMKEELREGKRFTEFLEWHIPCVTNMMNEQLRHDECGCKALFEKEIKLDAGGKSLMWHALQQLYTDAHRDMAVHLIEITKGHIGECAKVEWDGQKKDPVEYLIDKLMDDNTSTLALPLKKSRERDVLEKLEQYWSVFTKDRKYSCRGATFKFEKAVGKILDLPKFLVDLDPWLDIKSLKINKKSPKPKRRLPKVRISKLFEFLRNDKKISPDNAILHNFVSEILSNYFTKSPNRESGTLQILADFAKRDILLCKIMLPPKLFKSRSPERNEKFIALGEQNGEYFQLEKVIEDVDTLDRDDDESDDDESDSPFVSPRPSEPDPMVSDSYFTINTDLDSGPDSKSGIDLR